VTFVTSVSLDFGGSFTQKDAKTDDDWVYWGTGLKGFLWDCRVYPWALTAGEIAVLYAEGAGGSTFIPKIDKKVNFTPDTC